MRASVAPDAPSVMSTLSAATLIVPVVVRFSFPKLIDPPESVMLPLARVRFPIVEPVANATVSVVERLWFSVTASVLTVRFVSMFIVTPVAKSMSELAAIAIVEVPLVNATTLAAPVSNMKEAVAPASGMEYARAAEGLSVVIVMFPPASLKTSEVPR